MAKLNNILVTGGAGFIGSAFVRLMAGRGVPVAVLDKLTYSGDLKRLEGVNSRFRFYKADICNKRAVDAVFASEKPGIVVHFAAESHVDRSIKDAAPFVETNIKGTQVLLDASRKYGVSRFIFVSSDEVYGEIAEGKFREDSPLRPNNPYAASKAAADLLVQAYIRTNKFPAIIVRPSNTYGPWQYPEKLIPLSILRILKKEKIPVYGRGRNVREWLYVDDCVSGIAAVMDKGKIGGVYNLGSACESRNIDTVKLLLEILGEKADRFKFVKDRPGHDIRYSLNSRKAGKEFGWKPKVKLAGGLKLTVAWSREYRDWLKSKLADVNKLYNK
jgi:dTDP-glucose 4,6-dehydratase